MNQVIEIHRHNHRADRDVFGTRDGGQYAVRFTRYQLPKGGLYHER